METPLSGSLINHLHVSAAGSKTRRVERQLCIPNSLNTSYRPNLLDKDPAGSKHVADCLKTIRGVYVQSLYFVCFVTFYRVINFIRRVFCDWFN